ncbi:MAG TPA: DUF1080 domain-containing protein [Cyclobacteriaceae bacterium]
MVLKKALLIIALSSATLLSFQKKEHSYLALFNGKDLTGWDTYLGPAFDSIKGKFDSLSTKGLNNDPNKVFSVVIEDGEPALHVSGNGFGGIATKSEFENYHLSVQFKWGTRKFQDRKDKPRDSGILYHAVGPFDAAYGNWMCSQEFQIQEGDCGDYWSVAGSIMDIPAMKLQEKQYVYDPHSELVTFSYTSASGKRCRKKIDGEKPTGEWNTVDIYCLGNSSVHIINNVVVMKLFHSRYPVNGKEIPMTKGKIELQTEGAEVFYRHVQLEPITKFPEALTEGN